MKHVSKENALVIKNSDTSSLLEYSVALSDRDIDFAINNIDGRYPERGYCTNKVCKELVYVLSGDGSLNKQEESVSFRQGDLLLIEAGEVYYWEGHCELIMSCTPAWYKEHCELIGN